MFIDTSSRYKIGCNRMSTAGANGLKFSFRTNNCPLVSVTILILKKSNHQISDDYRSINLLNTDYKLYA